ncbi:MAG: competence/damage-inducible protein A [Bacillota bacterium]|nr:competence/damage-inducible protein A [Bacillota bacterium]
MKADLICVGNELLTGLVENSNAGFLARSLWTAGIAVRESCVVADDKEMISSALDRAMEQSDIVIITGGLGPTEDDLTKEALADILGRSLSLDLNWLEKIESFFQERGLTMSDNNRKQAMVIEGSIMLENKNGTAPGAVIDKEDKLIFMLPGPPNEMKAMFEEDVLPFLSKRIRGGINRVKTLKCAGIGESLLEEKIKSLGEWELPRISYIARGHEVHLQIKGNGNQGEADASIAEAENRLRNLLGDYIYGTDNDTLAERIADLLKGKKWTLALAESCTGGLMCDAVTDIPGSSRFFKGGVVSYSREAKINVLGIKKELIELEGEVSAATAEAMARSVISLFGTDCGVGITGVAGPQSDSSGSPIGLVYIAAVTPVGFKCHELIFGGGRRAVKERAVQTGFNILRKMLDSE